MANAKTNIRDVANAAGVSHTTVSMVLNNSPVPSAETREKVLKTAQALNYQPDPLFRQVLQRRRTGQAMTRTMTQTIGFLTSEMIVEKAQRDDGYYSRVLAGIQRATERQRYHLMVKSARAEELAPPAMVTEGRVDGLVIEGDFPELLRGLLAKRLPVSFIDRTYADLEADSVMPNIERAVREQLQYLWGLGHRNIVTFQHAVVEPRNETYLRAFHQFFAERKQPLTQPRLCERRDINPTTHARVMAEYARELAEARPLPTALVTGDGYALSLLAEFERLGLRVPQDLSVIGMDDVLAARLASPQLTSYRFPMEEMGRAATELLIERIEDRHRPVRHLLINGQLVERASCARATGEEQ